MAGDPKQQVEAWTRSLLDDPSNVTLQKVQVLTEIRELVDIFQSHENNHLLNNIISAFLECLSNCTPAFNSMAQDHNFCNLILDIIHRIPLTENMKRFAVPIFKTVIHIVRNDNEENAVMALKILINLIKAFKNELEQLIFEALELICEIYKAQPASVDANINFSEAQKSTITTRNSSHSLPINDSPIATDFDKPSSILKKGMQSFKTAAECPIVIALLFQTHREQAVASLSTLTPLVIQNISLQPKLQQEAHKNAARNQSLQIGPVLQLKNNTNYVDMIVSQIKAVSFLSYLYRCYANAVRQQFGSISEDIIRLFQDCPPEMSTARKELMVATRHILSTDLRSQFVERVDLLLEDRVLIGDGLTAIEYLKPLSYSMLADLLHHIRAELSRDQVFKVIQKYSASLLDKTLPIGIQTMSAKLLLIMIDRIVLFTDKADNRLLLYSILVPFTEKFESLIEISGKWIENTLENQDEFEQFENDIENYKPIKMKAKETNSLKDLRNLSKTLIIGLRTILYGLKSSNPPPPTIIATDIGSNWNDSVRGLGTYEVQLFRKILIYVCKCFMIYHSSNSTEDKIKADSQFENIVDLTLSQSTSSITSSREEKDLLESFATIYIHLDPATFIEILESELANIYEFLPKCSNLLHIFQFFLTNANSSPNSAGVLLRFMMSRIEELGHATPPISSITLRLFRFCFMAVTLFPDVNESVLQVHVAPLIIQCLHLSNKVPNSLNYFILLKFLFRGVGGGRFDILHREVMPLLQVLLECLNSLLQSSRKQYECELYAELCLTVPVRLSVLLPFMNYLMKPLIIALNGGSDLVSHGLRTFELCLDNLTQDFLDPILRPVMTDLMQALWKNLKPQQNNQTHSHNALKILGKLGGRNRSYLGLPSLKYDIPIDDGYVISIQPLSEPTLDIKFHYQQFISRVGKFLETKHLDVVSANDSFNFLDSVIKRILEDFVGYVEITSESLKALYKSYVDLPDTSNYDIGSFFLERNDVTGLLNGMGHADQRSSQTKVFVHALAPFFGSCKHHGYLKERLKTRLLFINALFIVKDMQISVDAGSKDLTSIVRSFKDEKASAIQLTFVKVLVDQFASDDKEMISIAKEILQILCRMSKEIANNSTYLWRLSIFRNLVFEFSHRCFHEDVYNKNAGLLGIEILVSEFGSDQEWIRMNQSKLVRGLLSIVKDAAHDKKGEIRYEAMKALIAVVQAAVPLKVSEDDLIALQHRNELVNIFIMELSNAGQSVRETAQNCLDSIAATNEISTSTLISLFKENLLNSIFQKPLRALPLSMQIGHIGAVTYFINLRPIVLELNEELLRLLYEVLAVADAEDEALVTITRASQYKSVSALVKLRVVCISLLSAAISTYDLNANQQVQIRSRIIGVLLKALYAKSPEIVEVANKGLRNVLAQNQKLPKELLQGGLKPILMNLSDHKRLTVAGLEGLARLLELLANYFKVEIGRKLLDHIKAWADNETLFQISSKPLEDQPAMKIITAILNIFRLLPSQANQFLKELIQTVYFAEQKLRRSQTSPLRAPLIKFLIRYPQDTWDFFLKNISNRDLLTFFCQLLEDPSTGPIHQTIFLNKDFLIETISDQSSDSTLITTCWVLMMTLIEQEFIEITPDFLEVINTLAKNQFQQMMIQNDSTTAYGYLRYKVRIRIFFSIFCKYLDANIDHNIDLIQAIIQTVGINADNQFSKSLRRLIIFKLSKEGRDQIISSSLASFSALNMLPEMKLYLFTNIINPTFIASSRGIIKEGDIENSMILHIQNEVWSHTLTKFDDEQSKYAHMLIVEVFQLSSLLLQHNSTLTKDLRKDIVKFAWNFLKLNDIMTKHAACVTISYFIAAYDTPAKIVTQIFVALLRAHHTESASLVRQALSILGPVLPERLPLNGNDNQLPIWVKWVKRILAEDYGNLPILCNVLLFVRNNWTLFAKHKSSIIHMSIHYLHKLAFQSNATLETKTLVIDLVSLIIADESSENEVSNSNTEESQTSVVDVVIVTFLLRYVCLSNELYSKDELTERGILLLETALSRTKNLGSLIRLGMFDRILMQLELSEDNHHTLANAIVVLKAIVKHHSSEWILNHLIELQSLLERALKLDVWSIQSALSSLLGIILKTIAQKEKDAMVTDEESSTIQEFNSHLITIVQENVLQNTNHIVTAMISEAICESNEPMVDQLLPSLVKEFAKLCKEHIGSSSTVFNVAAATGPSDQDITLDPDVISELIKKLLTILRNRIAYLGDQRRFLLGALIQLIEKSPRTDICRFILEMVKKWIFEYNESFPTNKEKTLLLLKMTVFESRTDMTLIDELLEVIIAVYEDPRMASTEFTARLEHAFLIGTRAKNSKLRLRFMQIFNKSIPLSLLARLNYILGVQNWELMVNYYWIIQACQLLIGGFHLGQTYEELESIAESRAKLKIEFKSILSRDFSRIYTKSMSRNSNEDPIKEILLPLSRLQFLDDNLANDLWIEIMRRIWTHIPIKDRNELSKTLVYLLANDYHTQQSHKRPNVVKTIINSVAKLEPPILMPPHLLKLLGNNYNCQHTVICLLEESISSTAAELENPTIKSSFQDALVEMYANLSEDDMFYGFWRRRCQYLETNAALLYEQNGIWDKGEALYESAQVKARTGVLAFSESEFTLWEDHWIYCAERLQQWDILNDLAKHEGYTDLLLECAWRTSDWVSDRDQLESYVKSLRDYPSPRRYTFEAFIQLQKYLAKQDTNLLEFNEILDKAMQISLKKWYQLPSIVSNSHVYLFQSFQQYLELHEASLIYQSLASTHIQNLEAKAMEIKNILQIWRERLPNLWDDINIWSDLVAWRQLIFSAINKVFLPLTQQNAGSSSNHIGGSFLFRGYHETAWIVNRFAHVARKQYLPEVCIKQLTKIYTLPNIEIQEAFLKLREQAKCHYNNQNEIQQGLEVISNTNLMYFGIQQKAEFFTFKGMFLAKLNQNDDANQAFATAVQIDLSLAKAWAEWGKFNDDNFKKNPQNISYACSAVSCYLQAAGLYQNRKAQKLLNRILWLLSFDDIEGSVSKAYDSYRGEIPVWYWIYYIPQLLTALSHKEARHARGILARIAKLFPQALHFQLRTTREDYSIIKRQAISAAQNASKVERSSHELKKNSPSDEQSTLEARSTPKNSSQSSQTDQQISMSNEGSMPYNRQPWEHVEDLMSLLKTAYPLLALTMETMVDQIQSKFKSPPNEDAYRLIVALLNDGIQYVGRLGVVNDETQLPAATQANISRFADGVLPKDIKTAFEDDFVHSKPNLQTYVEKLRNWRDRFEILLDQRPNKIALENVSPWLSEFQYARFDDIEVLGQYLQQKENNNDFVRIASFFPDLNIVRVHGICFRRLTMRGHDGSVHPFSVQYPSARHSRREERMMQLFRILNVVISKKKETRKRNLYFNLPLAIPLAPHIRLVADNPSYITFQSIYESYCYRKGMRKDEALIAFFDRIRAASADLISIKDSNESNKQQYRREMIACRTEVLEFIQTNLIPDTIFTEFFKQSFTNYMEYWSFRKVFTLQYAMITFMTYVMSMNLRFPHKFSISRENGNILGTELLPAMASQSLVFFNGEAVPFRLTPNLQNFMTPTGIEGVFSSAIMAVARCLSEPEFDLDKHLSIFVRDELIWWFTQQHRPLIPESELKEKINLNVEHIVRRVSSLSQMSSSNALANQTVLDLISQAVNPRYLAQMDQLWAAWI